MYVTFYGRFYGKVDACANGVYQALSPPPLKGPGDEASFLVAVYLKDRTIIIWMLKLTMNIHGHAISNVEVFSSLIIER